jgi:putative addiction module component (TIGR02574 family)
MTTEAKKLLQGVLELPIEDRAALVDEVLASFEVPPDPANEQKWADEAESRLEAYKQGKAGTIPAQQQFEQARRAREG